MAGFYKSQIIACAGSAHGNGPGHWSPGKNPLPKKTKSAAIRSFKPRVAADCGIVSMPHQITR